MASSFSLIVVFLLFNFVSSEKILEEGYAVTTVIDGHKLIINPWSVLARPGSSDLLLLDFQNSLLYTVSFPLSNESKVKRILSGEPKVGYRDGELCKALFNKPRNLAVDAKGNVYVADRDNKAIRKITTSGTVTTIAGGYSNVTGHQDGAALNATFSNDFELAIVADRCILLVVDHGTQLVRQIDLKPEDCATASPAGQIFGLGAVTVWTLGLGLSCVLGLAVGILVRPYIIPCVSITHDHVVFHKSQKDYPFITMLCRQGGSTLIRSSKVWKPCLIQLEKQVVPCLIHLGKQVVILCSAIRSAVANCQLYALLQKLFWLCLSHLSLMFRDNVVESTTLQKVSVSLLDSDDLSDSGVKKSQICADQLKDLISFDGNQNVSNVLHDCHDVLPDCHGKIDALIQSNVMGFAKVAEENIVPVQPVGSSLFLVKRR